MGYAQYLRDLLRPLGVYKLDETSFSGAELEAVGSEMGQAVAAYAGNAAGVRRYDGSGRGADELGAGISKTLCCSHHRGQEGGHRRLQPGQRRQLYKTGAEPVPHRQRRGVPGGADQLWTERVVSGAHGRAGGFRPKYRRLWSCCCRAIF